MTTNYDTITEEYQQAKLQPWRHHIESFTLMGLAGDLRGKAVVDLACGDGYYTRLLRKNGAARVIGVDLSEGMVNLARAQEAANPLGVEYLVGDGRNLELPPEHDLVVAAYLLNYARDREELAAMCRGVAGCLKPGGRFVTVNTNPGLDFRTAPSYRRYGFETHTGADRHEGAPITWTFFLESGPLSIENYYIGRTAHDEVLHSAGFREVRWHRPRLAHTARRTRDRDYWATFLAAPPVIFIECLK